jgi:hypothetical protein
MVLAAIMAVAMAMATKMEMMEMITAVQGKRSTSVE